MSKVATEYSLLIAPEKDEIPKLLNNTIASICSKALKERDVFTIALSGGSLSGFLASIVDDFQGIDPQFEKWHVLLADERCVPTSDKDSNLGSLNHFLDKTSIPKDQIHGIDESLLESGTTDDIAAAYENVVDDVLAKSGGALDLAVAGFGPDVCFIRFEVELSLTSSHRATRVHYFQATNC